VFDCDVVIRLGVVLCCIEYFEDVIDDFFGEDVFLIDVVDVLVYEC